jgi:hypothetical protein
LIVAAVLEDALAAIQDPDEFWWVSDSYRLNGQSLLSLSADNASAAEVC